MLKKITFLLLISFSSCFSQAFFVNLQIPSTIKNVYKFDIKEDIGPAIGRKVSKAMQEARSLNVDYILIHLNTYGGMVDVADSMRSKFLYSKIPVIVFVDNNAASAGALISIACNKIYMRTGASIGAATVVNQSGEQMPDKYQSYMRSMMRSTAEARGRNPQIAEAMVDPKIDVEGVTKKGQVLTFTATEAMKHGFCDGIAESIPEVLKLANIENYVLVEQEIHWLENIIGFLLNPAISSLLIMVIIGGIYFELQTPGIGFPIVASIVASILYFAPHYLDGLAANWEIFLFFMGLVLIVVEIFVFPGFGISGVAGIVSVIASLTFSMIENDLFDFSLTGWDAFTHALFTVFIAFAVAIVFSVLLGKGFMKSAVFQRMVLQSEQKSSEGYTVKVSSVEMVGKSGISITVLRPAGTVEIEDEHYDANSEGAFIEKGEKIIVIRQESAHLVVRKLA